MMAAACWVLASFIRGTFKPSEIIAKESTASACVSVERLMIVSNLQTPAMICVSMPN